MGLDYDPSTGILSPKKLSNSLLAGFIIYSFVVFFVLWAVLAKQAETRIRNDRLYSVAVATSEAVKVMLDGRAAEQDFQKPFTGAARSDMRAFLEDKVLSDTIVKVELWSPAGQVIYASDEQSIGKRFPLHEALREAVNGTARAMFVPRNEAEAEGGRVEKRRLLDVYVPLSDRNGNVYGVYEVYRVAGDIESQIAAEIGRTTRNLTLGLLALYVALFWIFRGATQRMIRDSSRIGQQNTELRSLTSELKTSKIQLEDTLGEILEALVRTLEARDSYTAGHSDRVARFAAVTARHMGLEQAEIEKIVHAAKVHDIGKTGIPDGILNKPGPLTREERATVARHPQIGAAIVRSVTFMADIVPAVRHHHERWDGRGYPDALAGEEIPIAGRILAVADAFDAMTSSRTYRPAMPIDEALRRLVSSAGRQFDPECVDAFIASGAGLEESYAACDNELIGKSASALLADA